MAQLITIPYSPRTIWRHTIHAALMLHRFAVLVAHRRFGKTVGVVNHIIKKALGNALPAPQYAYIAPFRNQAKMIAWNYLKFYTSTIPGRRVNESDLFVELPSLHPGQPGARIYIVGADNPDTLRGTYWDGVVLDEYAQIKPELWSDVLLAAIEDRTGWAVFLGTPKGQNQFFELFQNGQKDPEWFVGLYRGDETGIFTPAQLEHFKKNMPDSTFRQEILCDFTASASNVLITIDMVYDATLRIYKPDVVKGAARVLGIDPARFGDDRSVIYRREGLIVYPPKVFTKIDNMSLAAVTIQEMREFRPDASFCDAGAGAGVIDRVRQLGYDITEVPFGSTPMQPGRFVDKRSEMWYLMYEWLLAGGCIPNDPALKTDLTVPTYSYDSANKIKLEKKDDIKKRPWPTLPFH